MGVVSEKLRASARGETCTLRTSYCSGNNETVVLCHAPSEWKGMGNKSHDWCAAFGCYECHTAMDQHRFDAPTEAYYWLRGILRTWARWIERGLVVIPVDPATAKRRPKRKSNIQNRPLAGTKASGWKKPMRGPVERRDQE